MRQLVLLPMKQNHLMRVLFLWRPGNLGLNFSSEHNQASLSGRNTLLHRAQSRGYTPVFAILYVLIVPVPYYLFVIMCKYNFREFKILNLLEFSSKRKRMTV